MTAVSKTVWTGSRWLILAAVIAAVAVVGRPAMAAPSLMCETPTFDFGLSDNTGSVEHAFTIWNRGDSLLEMNRVVACCGATAVLESKTVAPGTNTRLHVTLSLQGRHDKVKKVLYLGTNDPKEPYYQLVLVGAVSNSVQRIPRAGTGVVDAALGAAVVATNSTSIKDTIAVPVTIDYFFEPDCLECQKVENEVLPEFEDRFEGFYRLNKWDVGVKTNMIRMATCLANCGVDERQSTCMILDQNHVLNGFDDIKRNLVEKMNQCIAERLEPGWKPPEPITITPR